jgi:predicted TIM-barrel fold metal-dependent hydrolase
VCVQGLDDPIDRSIPFVDAHHHLWDLGILSYPWLTGDGDPAQTAIIGEYAEIRLDWGPERFAQQLRSQHVVATVHVEAACLPRQAVDETRWLANVSARCGFPNALVVSCDLRADDAAATLEAHLAASPLTRSVRSRPDLPADVRFRRGLRAAASLGLSYELSQSPGGLIDGLQLAFAMPDLQLIVGHAGLPRRRDVAYQALWRREMRMLAQAPNVAVKISGLPMADHSWTVESIRPWVLDTIDAFGVERCMFGTNWPVDSLFSSYTRLVDAYRLVISGAGLTIAEQSATLHGNAERLYGIREGAGGVTFRAEAATCDG